MSIDEAIKQFKEDAEYNRADLDLEWAEENEQLAEWLEELKAKRKMLNFLFEVINPNDMEDYMRIYNSTDVKVDGGKNG